MDGSERKEEKSERRFSQEQYDMLLRCSEKKDITEWNQWCEEHPDEEILLEGVNLEDAHLENAHLEDAHLESADLGDAHLESAKLGQAHLEGADLRFAHLEDADLRGAHLESADLGQAHLENADLLGANLENARLWGANLESAYLTDAHLENAYLGGAHLENAYLGDAHLENAILYDAHLENAKLRGTHLENAKLGGAHLENANLEDVHLGNAYLSNAHLENANLSNAHLENANLRYAHLENANFTTAIVDGATLIWECEVDHKTKFTGVGLGTARIDPETQQLLEYNVRWMNWEKWYRGEKAHKPFGKIEKRKERRLRACQAIGRLVLTSPVRLFWSMSNYGMSTVRVVGVFFLLALLFAGIYLNWAYWRPPGIVSNLVVQPEIGEAVWHYFGRVLIRPVYFSIVTMTTLGFGDMYANKGSIAGHVILGVQVILGYVLLGALITRFAVLFTAGGPAGKFEGQKKKVDSVSPDNGI